MPRTTPCSPFLEPTAFSPGRLGPEGVRLTGQSIGSWTTRGEVVVQSLLVGRLFLAPMRMQASRRAPGRGQQGAWTPRRLGRSMTVAQRAAGTRVGVLTPV